MMLCKTIVGFPMLNPMCQTPHSQPCFRVRTFLALAARLSMFVLLLVSASNGGAQVQPLHTSRFNNWFIAPDEMMPGICSPADGSLKCEIALETEAALYYKAIGIYETANDPMGKPI